MPKKHALLIANTEYRDGKLATLSHPGLAYAELAEALKDPARGAFSQVETLVNANLSHVLNTLDRFFSRKPADDVLLVYVGAHGFVDNQGELFLALKESDRFRLKSTALMAAVLGMNMDQCPSPHKLLILDCRIHSPYQDPRGPQNALRYDPARIFAGRGLPKRILSAAEPPPAAAATAPPASSTQKLPVTAPKTLTRVLAETFRTPAGAARTAFTAEEWWNAAAAELKASKAEPPLRHDVGDPPVTVLRGTSLPRQELALSAAIPGREPTASLPSLAHGPEVEAEAEWSRLSGIFPLEMFAPGLAPAAAEPDVVHPPLRPAVESPASGLPDQFAEAAETTDPKGADPETAGAEAAGADAEAAGTMAGAAETAGAIAEAAEAEMAERTVMMAAPRGDQTIVADLASFVEGADIPGRDAPRPGPRDTFTDLRARLRSQEEEEQRARLEAEREEAAQREKLNRWKARWEARTREKEGPGPHPDAATPRAAGDEGPATAPPAETAPGKPDPDANRKSYRGKIAALQKTLYVPPPDEASGTDAPRQAPQPPPPAAPPQAGFQDGTATVMVSKDQFLNTGSHRPPTLLTPGATIHLSREEFLGTRAAPAPARSADQAQPAPSPAAPTAGRETAASAPSQPASLPPKPGRDAGRDKDGTLVAQAVPARRGGAKTRPRVPPPPRVPGSGRRKALWALAGLVPVGLCLLLYFGTQAGLFWSLGLGPDPAAARAEQARAAAMRFPEEVAPADEEGIILPAEAAAQPPPASAPAAPAETRAPATPAASADAPATAPAAAPVAATPSGAAVPNTPASVPPRAPVPAAAAPAKPLPAAQAVQAVPAPPAAFPAPSKAAPRPASDPEARAARAAQEAERLARAQYRQDSLRAYRIFRDSLLTARAQSMQDSIQQARLLREQERSRRAEAETARLAAARARQDSLRGVKDSAQAEALLRKTVNQALKAGTPELRSLYNRFALGYPGLQGEVVLELLVAPDGEIEKGALRSSTTGNKMFDQLVLGNVMEWRMRPFKSREPKAVLVALNFPISP